MAYKIHFPVSNEVSELIFKKQQPIRTSEVLLSTSLMPPFPLHTPHSRQPLHMHAVARRGVAAMSAQQVAAKETLRKSLKQALRQLVKEDMQRESDAIASHVLASPLLAQHQTFGIYVHAQRLREVDTLPILNELLARAPRARTYVPLVVDRQANMKLLHLESLAGLREVPPFGIREPSEQYEEGRPREDVLGTSRPLEMLIMPGLGFDQRGGRLGRGGGYYDAFIERCRAHAASHERPPPLLVALAFSAQLVDEVPMCENDQPVDVLVTADGVCRLSERGQQF